MVDYHALMSTDAHRLGRHPERRGSDESLLEILDEAYVAHVGFTDPKSSEVVVIPVAFARDGKRILLHGSTGSRTFMAFKSGVQVCATVTLLDGLVAARTPFNSSMNYRSVMIFGAPRLLEGEEKVVALRCISERLIPGLWDAGREMVAKEYAQTMVVELALDDVSVKVRSGGAEDHEDAHLPIWAGQIPMKTLMLRPVADAECADMALPDYIRDLYPGDIST